MEPRRPRISTFAVRLPLLPGHQVAALYGGGPADPAAPPTDASHDAERAATRAALRALLADPLVAEALFLSSRSLWHAALLWRDGRPGQDPEKTERALLRSLLRMASRCTPLRTVAGIGFGTFSDAAARFDIAPPSRGRRRTRLDGSVLAGLIRAIAEHSDAHPDVPFRLNPARVRRGPRIAYSALVPSTAPAGALAPSQRALDVDDAIEALLESCGPLGERSHTLTELRSWVAQTFEVDADEAAAFVDGLVGAQVLVPALGVTVAGEDPAFALLKQLRAFASCSVLAAQLQDVLGALDALDAEGLGLAPARASAIEERVRALGPGPADSLAIDVTGREANVVLPLAVHAELERAVLASVRCFRTEPPALSAFRNELLRLHDTSEIPLLDALALLPDPAGQRVATDDDANASLLEGIPFGSARVDVAPDLRFERGTAHLLRRLTAHIARGDAELQLTDEDLRALSAGSAWGGLFDGSADALASIAAASVEALTAGEYLIVLRDVMGPAGRMTARFAYDEPRLLEHLQACARAEAQAFPGCIVADVTSVTDPRTLTLVAHPQVLAHSIVIGGAASDAPGRISLEQLTVSVQNGFVVVRHKDDGAVVCPRILNTEDAWSGVSHPAYRLLALVQEQTAARAGFSWGPLEVLPSLPRVVLGRVVLAPARWNVRAAELDAAARASGAARTAAVCSWRCGRGIPRHVVMQQTGNADQSLPVDLEHASGVDLLLHELRAVPRVTLREALPAADALCARVSTQDGPHVGPEEGRPAFFHELAVSFAAGPSDALRAAAPHAWRALPRVAGALQRSVLPGDGWVYLRIYRRFISDDELLALLAPVLDAMAKAGSAHGWFFVPYADPDPELRVRVRSRAVAEVLQAVREVLQPHIDSGAVWRLEFGTYDREVDRYGGAVGMGLCEELFVADSAAVVDVLPDVLAEGDDGVRLCAAALGVVALVRDFGLDEERTLGLWQALATRYRAEHGIERAALAPTARVLGPRLRAVLEPDTNKDGLAQGWVASATAVLQTRSRASAPTVAALRAHAAAGELTLSLEELLESLIHMHCIRVLRGDVRKKECVLYDALERITTSNAARTKAARGVSSR